MGVFDAIRRRLGMSSVATPHIRAQNELREYATLEDLLKDAVRSSSTDAGVHVSTTTAERFAAVASCLRVKADDASTLPLIVYRKRGKTRQPADDLRVYELLKEQPNEWMTSADFRNLQERRRLTAGFAPAMIIRNARGEPDELIPMDPARTEIEQDDALRIQFKWTRRDGRRLTLQRDEVFCVWYGTHDGVKPISPVQMFRETIGDGVAMRRHGSSFFGNGAQPGMVLMTEKPMDPQSKKEMRADWDERFQGDRKYGTAILDQGVKAETVSITMEDAQYIESRKFNRSEICGIYGVPPHRIGDLDRATFSNIEHQSLEYVVFSLRPDLVKWEQAIKRDLLADDASLYARHTVDGLLRGDAKSRAEAQAIKRRHGVISANEWRALDDMNPREDEGGDGYIVERNMQPDDGVFREPAQRREEPENDGNPA